MAGQNNEALRLWLWLTQAEKSVMKAIRESDTPFLGLLGEAFTKEIREAMAKAIAANPTVVGYVNRLESHPALFTANLAWHVMHGMGQGGYFSLYPHIQKALCMQHEPGQTEREPLWQAFRRSLLLLGLEPSPRISGPHFMVNEYLRQAGVPASHDKLQQGTAWLKANQRLSGRWFTRSLSNDKAHYIANAGTGFALLAITACEPVAEPKP